MYNPKDVHTNDLTTDQHAAFIEFLSAALRAMLGDKSTAEEIALIAVDAIGYAQGYASVEGAPTYNPEAWNYDGLTYAAMRASRENTPNLDHLRDLIEGLA